MTLVRKRLGASVLPWECVSMNLPAKTFVATRELET
jgi:hypothetical protein